MIDALGLVLFLAGLVVIGVALYRITRHGYESDNLQAAQPILLAGAGLTALSAVLLLTA